MNLWYVGVAFEIVSTMSGTIGKQLIRLSENVKKKAPPLSRTLMVVGLVVNTVCGPLLDTAAYSFATQSLIAPFGGLDVVWNAALAPCILGEKLTKRRLIGCILLMTGTIMSGAFGNHEDAEYTLEYLEETLVNLRVLMYFVGFAVWFLINKLFLMKQPAGSAIRGVSLGATAGSIAGNMFCVKGAIELIQRSIHYQEGEIWLHWLPYVLLVGAAFFALSNVVYMTQGLREYEALFMVTIYEGSMIMSGCLSGAVVLMDLKGLAAWRCVMYFVSIAIIAVGMYVIFSQEAMNKSSLISGSASLKDTPSLDPTQITQKSLHASLSPSLDSPKRGYSDPNLSTTASEVSKQLDFSRGSEDDPSQRTLTPEGQRNRAETAPANLGRSPDASSPESGMAL